MWVSHIEYHVICGEWKFDLLLADLDAFYLCCLIAEARTSNTLLNNSGESGHPCHVPELRGKALSVPPFLSYMAFIILRYNPSIPTFWGFLSREMLYFVKCFLWIYWEDHVILVLAFINMMYQIDCFVDIEPALHPGINTTWSWWITFFNVLLDPVGWHTVENFCTHVHQGNWSIVLLFRGVFV